MLNLFHIHIRALCYVLQKVYLQNKLISHVMKIKALLKLLLFYLPDFWDMVLRPQIERSGKRGLQKKFASCCPPVNLSKYGQVSKLQFTHEQRFSRGKSLQWFLCAEVKLQLIGSLPLSWDDSMECWRQLLLPPNWMLQQRIISSFPRAAPGIQAGLLWGAWGCSETRDERERSHWEAEWGTGLLWRPWLQKQIRAGKEESFEVGCGELARGDVGFGEGKWGWDEELDICVEEATVKQKAFGQRSTKAVGLEFIQHRSMGWMTFLQSLRSWKSSDIWNLFINETCYWFPSIITGSRF